MRIDLLLGHAGQHGRFAVLAFQYPRADRLIVGVPVQIKKLSIQMMFQYPRADRLIVGARREPRRALTLQRFSILVRIDLLLGRASDDHGSAHVRFQYPRADRLIVGEPSGFLIM